MESETSDTGDALQELADEIDIRCVSVIWTPDTPFPEVTFSGCSAYEAIGFLDAALRRLRRDYELPESGDEDDE